MKILPDTNALSRHLRGLDAPLSLRLRQAIERGELIFSFIVHAELQYGAEKARLAGEERPHLRLTRLLHSLTVELLPRAAAEEYGQLRALLERRGERIGNMDLLLAAHALAANAVLITHNTREFARVPRLVVEDWQTAV